MNSLWESLGWHTKHVPPMSRFWIRPIKSFPPLLFRLFYCNFCCFQLLKWEDLLLYIAVNWIYWSFGPLVTQIKTFGDVTLDCWTFNRLNNELINQKSNRWIHLLWEWAVLSAPTNKTGIPWKPSTQTWTHKRVCRHRRMLTCLRAYPLSCARSLSVFLTTWLPGMRAIDARLASAVSTSMGKVNQQLGTPTPIPPSSAFLWPSSLKLSPSPRLSKGILGDEFVLCPIKKLFIWG